MSVDDRGTAFQYLEVPGTTPVVFVHGVGLDQNIWRAMLADFSGRSTLTYDLLGHGETSQPLGDHIFQPEDGKRRGLVTGLLISRMVLVGFSLGGQVANHFAPSYPEMVEALVLISTTYQRTSEEREAMAFRVQQAKAGDRQGLEASALQRWFSPEFLKANPGVEREILARLRNNDPAEFLESYELLSNAENHPVDFASLSMPTLVLTGDGDPGSTPRMAEDMAQAMPNARAEIIQGSKHLGIIEEHRQFSDAVMRFLAASES